MERSNVMGQMAWFAVLIALLTACYMLFTGCDAQNKDSNSASTQAQSVQDEPADDQITIDQLKFEMGKVKLITDRVLAVGYKNNSDFTIVKVDIQYDVSKKTSKSTLKKLFPESEGYSSSDIDDLREDGVRCTIESIVQPGSSSPKAEVALNWLDRIKNQKQFKVLNPSTIAITYIYNDMLYTEEYDYQSKSYMISNSDEYKEWPDGEVLSSVPVIKGGYVSELSLSEDKAYFTLMGISNAQFKQFVRDCKKNGYKITYQSDSGVKAENSQLKKEIAADYYDSDQKIKILVMPIDDQDDSKDDN